MATKFKTTNIKGKEYVMVNERMKYFRTCEDYRGWSITSEWNTINSEEAICIAVIRDDEGRVRANGTAYEKHGSTMINSSSHIENCETSAWGRALGNLGIGIDTSICSVEELQQAMKVQEQEKLKRMNTVVEMNKELREKVLPLPEEASDEKNRLWKEINDMAQGDPFIKYNKTSQQFELRLDGEEKKGGEK